jgi:UDP-sulfoquinovose synthase
MIKPLRCLILGGDGYLGWPTAMYLSKRGHEVMVIDNYLHRRLVAECNAKLLYAVPDLPQRCKLWQETNGIEIKYAIGDVQDHDFLSTITREFLPDTIIHYAEQRSAPYSMKGYEEAKLTLTNNLSTTFNLIWAVMREAPNAHIIKLGTLGEYGTPNIDIEEGWIDIEHKGRKEHFLYPRQGSSLYHTTKIHDTDLLWFYVRMKGLRVTDLMQGPVYGLLTDEIENNFDLLPFFDYDDIFGTVVNRFVVQAVAGIPLTVYGKGGQTRGFLNILDTLQSIGLVVENPAKPGEMRIFNQFTEQFSIIEIAKMVQEASALLGIKTEISHLENPRKELEEHYYHAVRDGLSKLGLKPKFLTKEILRQMIAVVQKHKNKIDTTSIGPKVRW